MADFTKDANFVGTWVSVDDSLNATFGKTVAQESTTPTVINTVGSGVTQIDVTDANTFEQPNPSTANKVILSQGTVREEVKIYTSVTVTNSPYPNDGFLTLQSVTVSAHNVTDPCFEQNRYAQSVGAPLYYTSVGGLTGSVYAQAKIKVSAVQTGLVLRHGLSLGATNAYIARVVRNQSYFHKVSNSVVSQLSYSSFSPIFPDGQILIVRFRVETVSGNAMLYLDVDDGTGFVEKASFMDSSSPITSDGNVGISTDVSGGKLDRLSAGTWT